MSNQSSTEKKSKAFVYIMSTLAFLVVVLTWEGAMAFEESVLTLLAFIVLVTVNE